VHILLLSILMLFRSSSSLHIDRSLTSPQGSAS
jgi:hypothetical protein